MKVKQKISETFDAFHTENAELHRQIRERDARIEKLESELFHLRGKTQQAVVPDLLDEVGS